MAFPITPMPGASLMLALPMLLVSFADFKEALDIIRPIMVILSKDIYNLTPVMTSGFGSTILFSCRTYIPAALRTN
jgi:hypothetical protein